MFGGQLFDTIVKILLTIAIASIIIAILPVSPFQSMLESLEALPYLNYFNWFFPVGKCLAALAAWAACLGVYYGVAWIFRQLDIISK